MVEAPVPVRPFVKLKAGTGNAECHLLPVCVGHRSQLDHHFVGNPAGGSAAEINIVGDIANNVGASVAVDLYQCHE